jgi:hypothetical protein
MFGQQVSAPVEVTLHAAGLDDEMVLVSNESNEVDQMPHLWHARGFFVERNVCFCVVGDA